MDLRLDSKGRPRIMKPHWYSPRYAKWPVWVQPKLNGIRCVAVREPERVRLFSSRGNEFTSMGHIQSALFDMMLVGEMWDGELYAPGLSFQQICGLVKRIDPAPDSAQIRFNVFDSLDSDAVFGVRDGRLFYRFTHWFEHWNAAEKQAWPVQRVSGSPASSHEEVMAYHQKFVEQDYEGIIVRNTNALYLLGDRSYDVLKFKVFEDAEFRIVDVVQACGKDAGTAIFVCETAQFDKFRVRPSGTLESRRQMWLERANHIGKKLTVQYQELSDTGVPIFPVGLGVRDYE